MKAAIKKLWHWEFTKLAFFLFVVLSAVLVFTLTPALFPSALISVLLFFIFTPLIDAAERKGISRTSGILGVFLMLAAGLAFSVSTLTPRVAQEVDAFQRGSSRYATNVTEKLKLQEARLLAPYPMFKNTDLTGKLFTWLQQSSDRFLAAMPNFASQFLICLLLVPFLTFILLKDAHEIRRQILKLVPNRHFETVYSLISRILDEMGGFVAARIIEAALVTGIVTLGCLFMKVPYAFMLGVFAGATNAIPYLGPVLGALPGLLLAVLDPAVPNQLLWITAIYTVANVIDMAVIFPLVVAKIVDLHPVVVVTSVILGSQLFGIVGMIVAVPITSILKILIQEVYSRVYDHTEALR
ncbi:MAG: AI-2E family transporter [Deltaproteobacteria bacterium]|nr:AI-2E family transporter [Deltaproteobacteria bacterium]